MLAFHADCTIAFEKMQVAFRELSEKMMLAEGRMERYWGISLSGEKDIIIL